MDPIGAGAGCQSRRRRAGYCEGTVGGDEDDKDETPTTTTPAMSTTFDITGGRCNRRRTWGYCTQRRRHAATGVEDKDEDHFHHDSGTPPIDPYHRQRAEAKEDEDDYAHMMHQDDYTHTSPPEAPAAGGGKWVYIPVGAAAQGQAAHAAHAAHAVEPAG